MITAIQSESLICGDCLEWMQSQPDNAVDFTMAPLATNTTYPSVIRTASWTMGNIHSIHASTVHLTFLPPM